MMSRTLLSVKDFKSLLDLLSTEELEKLSTTIFVELRERDSKSFDGESQ